MENYIVGIGEMLWDLLPEGKKLGGAPANFACHAAQLGFEAVAVSAVGNDPLGDEILARLAEKGLECRIARTQYPTGTVAVSLGAKGIPQYEIREGVAWDNIPFTPELERIAARTRCVCFGSLAQRSATSRTTINRFLDAMPGDSLRVFDINLRQHFYTEEVLKGALEKCGILKINDEEALVVARLFRYAETDIRRICLRLREEFGLEKVILTCGEQGSSVFHDGGESHLATPRITVADTVGAGDSFTAGFCCALLSGKSVAEAHAFAVELSAYVCTRHGATPTLPPQFAARIRE